MLAAQGILNSGHRVGAPTGMNKLRFLVSLTTNDNDYQIEQAQSAEKLRRSSASSSR